MDVGTSPVRWDPEAVGGYDPDPAKRGECAIDFEPGCARQTKALMTLMAPFFGALTGGGIKCDEEPGGD